MDNQIIPAEPRVPSEYVANVGTMPARISYVCKQCGKEFVGWRCENRVYCGMECATLNKGKHKVTHGDSGTRLYEIWCCMRSRCTRKGDSSFEDYGARGISVCSEWANDFVPFKTWSLANGYADHLEIDRIDNNGNYEPSNCRWSTRKQQMANTRKRRDGITSKFKGVSKHGRKWVAQMHHEGRNRYLGTFARPLAAALRYDDAVYEARGEYASLNFPERKRQAICG